MIQKAATLGLSLTLLASATMFAEEGSVPKGIPHLDHVFVIMMENHGYSQIVNNPNAPYINQLAKSANAATNYFAVAHPSLTNYLEVVGGSNFGVQTDNYPDWHNGTCSPNLSTGKVSTDTPATGLICPIWGKGTDAATPAIDTTNETQGLPGDINIDGKQSIAAEPRHRRQNHRRPTGRRGSELEVLPGKPAAERTGHGQCERRRLYQQHRLH